MKFAFIGNCRFGGITLGAIALANWLLVAAVLMALAIGSAAAQPECGGENLVAAMERDDPALAAALRAEAAETPNGKGLLWRIETEGAAPSWLFGTMHMTDPRVVTLPERAREAFDQSQLVVIETTDILDEAKMTAAVLARPDLMMFTGGETLSSLIPAEDRQMVSAALSERGIPLASVEKMKPWIISALVSLPACEQARKAAGAKVLDIGLAHEAEAAGKAVAGLETAASQLEAMASLPMDLHIDGLVETLKLGDRLDDVMETMVQLYIDGETGLFWPFFRAALPESGSDEGAYAAFQETMVAARNHGMAEHALPLIGQGGAFIAVGALHLPGKDGLVALLRARGMRVVAVR